MTEQPPLSSENPFWDFSLSFYGRREVSETCLVLQDHFGADVNILLYCCWVALSRGEELSSREIKEILDVIEPWQRGVVQKLRQIRTDMKSDSALQMGEQSEALREQIKRCELEGEKIEQTLLYFSDIRESVETPTDCSFIQKTAQNNLACYLQLISEELSEESEKLILILAEAICS